MKQLFRFLSDRSPVTACCRKFAFPEKFFFLDLSGLEVLTSEIFTAKAEVIFLIAPFERADRQQSLELNVSERTFRLSCSPIINLFEQTAEPVLLEQTKFEHLVIPDVRRRNALEIFSIDDVMTASPDRREVIHYEPFYGSHHGRVARAQTFWHANRRQSTRANDEGTEMFISLVDSTSHSAKTGLETLTVRCTCTNRDLPSRLPWGNENGDFDLESGAGVKKIISLKKPTGSLRAPLRRGLQWRLISHLSLNYLSLVEEGRGALQDILRLYNFSDETSLNGKLRESLRFEASATSRGSSQNTVSVLRVASGLRWSLMRSFSSAAAFICLLRFWSSFSASTPR